FCKYHLLHHRYLGEPELDPSVPNPTEARVVGGSRLMKTLWISAIAVIQGFVRTRDVRHVKFLDRWTLLNILVQIVTVTGLIGLTGFGPLPYLLASSLFALGLHPLGARWIQEHYVLAPNQETYSYYGPLNKVC